MSDPISNLPLFRAGAGPSAAEPTIPLDLPSTPTLAPSDPASGGGGALPSPPAGYGKLVNAAWPLLAVLARVRTGAVTSEPEALKSACIRHLKKFEQDAAVAGAAPDSKAGAHYALCTALDEAVLGTPWGDQSDWAQDSLLATFHGETWGGEKVFAIVERALAEPARDPDLAEMLYLLLSFGFQGRYHLRRNGAMEVESLRERLSAGLRRHSATPPPLPMALPRAKRRQRLGTFVPVWVVALVCLLAAVLLFLWLQERLLSQSVPLVPRFNAVVPISGA